MRKFKEPVNENAVNLLSHQGSVNKTTGKTSVVTGRNKVTYTTMHMVSHRTTE
jgi:hypothetical protein